MIRSQDRQSTGSPTTGSPNRCIPESPNHQITETSGSPNHRTASPDPRIKPRILGPPINRHPDHRITKSLDHRNTGSPDHLITRRSLRGPCISTAKRKTLSHVKSERVLRFATDIQGALQLPAVTKWHTLLLQKLGSHGGDAKGKRETVTLD